MAVAIRIDQETNAAEAFGAPLGVIAHLDDKQAAILVEAHGDGIDDQGLGCDQVETETGFDLKCAQRLRQFDRRNSGQVFWINFRFGAANGKEPCC